MSCASLLRCLGFCKRAVSIAILFSSLICCSFADPAVEICKAASSESAAPRAFAQERAALTMQGRVAGESYTLPNPAAGKASLVPAGTYANVVFGPGYAPATAPKISFGAGIVVLQGGADMQLLPVLSTNIANARRDEIQISSSGGDATLVLGSGDITGNIYLGTLSTRHTGKIIAGSEDGTATGGTVRITGSIDGNVRTVEQAATGNSIIQTKDADLIVSGILGGAPIGLVEAANGNITVEKNGDVRNSRGQLWSVSIAIQRAMAINVAGYVRAEQLFVRGNGTLKAEGPLDPSNAEGGRIDITDVIDGVNGALETGSKVTSVNDDIFFYKGILQGSSEISAGKHIGAQTGLTLGASGLKVDTMMAPITQGADGHLRLTAGGGIAGGTINVDSLDAKDGNIIAGYDVVAGYNEPDRITLTPAVSGTSHFPNIVSPRGAITAREIRSPQGGVYAGEINLSSDSDALLEARNLVLVKKDAAQDAAQGLDLPASTGDLNIGNGAFKLTGSPLKIGVGATIPQEFLSGGDPSRPNGEFASIIEGNLNARNNEDSSFTSLKVGGKAGISSGALEGEYLAANEASLSNVLSTKISDTLDIATDLDISGNKTADITNTKAGGAAHVSGGTYSGTNFTANSIDFSNVTKTTMTGVLRSASSLGISGNVAADINAAQITGEARISGGTYRGDSFNAQSAQFTDVTSTNLDSLNVTQNLAITGNQDSVIRQATAGGAASVSGGSYGGADLSGATIDFADMSAISITGTLKSNEGDISLKSSGPVNIATIDSAQGFSQQGGMLAGTNLKSGADASLTGVSKVTLANADIGGNLSLTDSANTSLRTATVAGSVNIDGGSFSTGNISTGISGNGNFTASDTSYDLGDDSVIRGTLNASQSSGTFSILTVEDVVKLSGGYLDGGTLNAQSGKFTDNATVYVDDLILSGNAVSLEIDDGSHVIVKNISDFAGTELVSEGGLIILGDPDDPSSWSELGDVNLSDGEIQAGKALVRAGDITGKGQGESADDIRAHQLIARTIDITDANLQLTGIRDFASEIEENLIIAQNGKTALGDITIGGLVDISGGTVQARSLKVGESAVFNNASVTLLGTGENASSIGGDFAIGNNGASRLGVISVGGDVDISGGSINADQIKAKGSAVFKGVGLALLGAGAEKSVIGGALKLQDNETASLGDIEIGGEAEAEGGKLSAGVLEAKSKVTLAGVELKLAGESETPGDIGGNLLLKDNATASLGYLRVAGNTKVDGGEVAAESLASADAEFNSTTSKITSLDITDGLSLSGGSLESTDLKAGSMEAADAEITARRITLKEQGAVSGGSLVAARMTAKDVTVREAQSRFGELTVTRSAEFSGGTLSATRLSADSATFREEISVSLENLIMSGSDKALVFGGQYDSTGGSRAEIGSLDLAGGTLNAGNSSAALAPVGVAIREFASGQTINGNIGVGLNGRLVLGTRDLGWLPSNLENARSVLAIAGNMRLGSGMGMHITGTGAAEPAANQIRFDAGSLFVIDGSNSRVYYVGDWIPSVNLSDSNGAVGALSAETATVPALVATGAQLYIRNPVPNTVIVALGQNITVSYADAGSLRNTREADLSPWTGVNLDYDNKDKVKIERLEGAYTGQFSVTPIDTTPSEPDPVDPTPSAPSGPTEPTPVDPTPVAPTDPTPTDPTPSAPDQPATPDTPSTPDEPSPVTPVNPSEPEPSQPEQPGQPDQSDTEQPDQPGSEQPVTPGNPAPVQPAKPKPAETHPNAHPNIHNVIQHELDKDNIGTEPRHLVTYNGAGFLSHTLAHDNPHEATLITESALRMVVLGAVPQMTLAANSAAEAAMAGRLGLNIERIEDLYARSIALWAVPIYKSIASWDMEAGYFDYDFHGGLGGVAIGGDVTCEDIIRAGLAFNIGGGYSKSGGQLAETSNNMSFWGTGAYAGLLLGDFSASVDVSFTSSYNKLKQETGRLDGWQDLKTDVTAWALGAGLDLEYRFRADFIDIIPHAGFKYHHLHVDDYDINHKGHAIIKGESFSQNIWTFPLGIRFSSELNTTKGWLFRPSLDFRVTPASGDLDARTKAHFTGTDLDTELYTKTMDYITWGGTAALEATIDNFTIGVSYRADAGRESMANTISAILRYEF